MYRPLGVTEGAHLPEDDLKFPLALDTESTTLPRVNGSLRRSCRLGRFESPRVAEALPLLYLHGALKTTRSLITGNPPLRWHGATLMASSRPCACLVRSSPSL